MYVLCIGETEAEMLGSGVVRIMFGITDVTRSRHVGPLPLLTADGFTHQS